MKHLNIYVRDESEMAYKKLKAFGMNIQDICRKALIKKAKELKL